MGSVDTTQCYDRISHELTLLTLQPYKVRQNSVASMLTSIQFMEYYLRTGFGTSTTYLGGKEDLKQGTCQGNTTAPSTWQQISSLLINAQKRAGHRITIVLPITKKIQNQVGILFVDNITLCEGLSENDEVISTPEKGQRSVNSWRSTLLVVGGELGLDKCSYTVHRMKPADNRKWEYVQEKVATAAKTTVNNDKDELDDL